MKVLKILLDPHGRKGSPFLNFFSLKNKDELGDHIFPSQYPKLQNEWSWLVFHDLKCGSSGVRGEKGFCHSWSLILEADGMNEPQEVGVEYNLEPQNQDLCIVNFVTYCKLWAKNEMKFQWWTGWYLKLSVWGIVHRICDMWISPAFAAAAVPTLYIKMSSFLFIPLFFGYFSPQKQENQIVILLGYRWIKALFCMRRLKTKKD